MADSDAALVKGLKSLLGDLLIFKIRAQGAHWNVDGVEFNALHDLFGDLYADVEGSLDVFAEAIRQHDEFAPYQVSSLTKTATLKDDSLSSNAAKTLLKDLVAKNDSLMDALVKVRKAADAAGDEGLCNFCQERLGAHLKWRWKLKASAA